jgi:hypothetical protein
VDQIKVGKPHFKHKILLRCDLLGLLKICTSRFQHEEKCKLWVWWVLVTAPVPCEQMLGNMSEVLKVYRLLASWSEGRIQPVMGKKTCSPARKVLATFSTMKGRPDYRYSELQMKAWKCRKLFNDITPGRLLFLLPEHFCHFLHLILSLSLFPY